MLFGFVCFGGEPPLPIYAVGFVHMVSFFFHDLRLPYVSALLSEASPHCCIRVYFCVLHGTACIVLGGEPRATFNRTATNSVYE